MKLRFYAEVTNTAGVWTETAKVSNSLFDPFGAAGAAQPYLFDQWSALYAEYRVLGMAVRVQASMGAVGITSTSAREVVVVFSSQAASFNSASHAAEQPYSKSKMWAINTPSPDIRMYMPMHKLMGVPKDDWDKNPNSGAYVSANPNSLGYIHIGCWDPYEIANVDTNFVVTVTFYTQWFNRQEPAVS